MPVFQGFSNGIPTDNEGKEEFLRKSKANQMKIWKEEFDKCSSAELCSRYLAKYSVPENPYVARVRLLRNEFRDKESTKQAIIGFVITILFIATIAAIVIIF